MFRSEYLSEKTVLQFFQLHYPELPHESVSEKVLDFIKKIESKQRDFENYILVLKDNAVVWSFTIFSDGPDVFGIQTPKYFLNQAFAATDWSNAMDLIKSRLLKLKTIKVSLRFQKNIMTENLHSALSKINFKKKNERIEFKSLLENLPNDTGTPIL